MDKNKNSLIEAYCKKGIAMCKLATIDSVQNKDAASEQIDEIDAIYSDIIKFIDPMDLKVTILCK